MSKSIVKEVSSALNPYSKWQERMIIDGLSGYDVHRTCRELVGKFSECEETTCERHCIFKGV
jgi:hypothetical protein